MQSCGRVKGMLYARPRKLAGMRHASPGTPGQGGRNMKHQEYSGKTAYVRYQGGPVGEPALEDCTAGEPERIVICLLYTSDAADEE